MTISNETVKQTFAGNDSTTTFAIPFDFEGTDEIKVYLENSGGTITLLTEGAADGYDLTGNPVANVEMKTAPATGETLLITRVNNRQQELDLVNAGSYSAQSVEDQFDRTTRQIQEMDEELTRTPKFKRTSTQTDITFPEPVADGLVKWNSDANALESLQLAAEDAVAVTLINDQTVGGQKTFTDKLVSDVDTAEEGIQINHDQNGNALDINKTAGTGSAIDVGDANFTVEQDGSFKAANEAYEVDSSGRSIHTVEQQMNHISTPGSAPAAGKLKIYPKTGDKLYTLNSSSSEETVAYESYVDAGTRSASVTHSALGSTMNSNPSNGILEFNLSNLTETDPDSIMTVANVSSETEFSCSIDAYVSVNLAGDSGATSAFNRVLLDGAIIHNGARTYASGERTFMSLANYPVSAGEIITIQSNNGGLAGGSNVYLCVTFIAR
jgi:hypothetical protein